MALVSQVVLLKVKNVRNKKTDGRLYMMSECMGWEQNSKDTFSLSYSYSDIKLQKISPDTKDKVQLQLVFHDGGANTFHFSNPAGRAAQIADRDSVKEILQQMLPKFRRKISSELEQKNRILTSDPDLFALYKELVVSQVITAEEFWTNQSHKLKEFSKLEDKTNSVGISAAFLADIKPETDGCNGLRYNLTADVIDSIFRTYPMVKQKHHEYVPHKMDKEEFWTKFFQSHYFHRDRDVTTGEKDLFTECAEKDDEAIQNEITRRVDDRLLDMRDDDSAKNYGSDRPKSASSSVNMNLIRRFNHHSTMILKSCAASGADLPSSDSLDDTRSVDNNKRIRLSENVQYEDLESDSSPTRPGLSLQSTDRYLYGPTPLTSMKYTTSDDLLRASSVALSEIGSWSPDGYQGVPSSTAVAILEQLSPGGALMVSSNQRSRQVLPEGIQSEVSHLYCALSELLRHFWLCFPTTSKSLEEKVMKMKTTLERFETARLNKLKETLVNHHYSLDLMCHMEEMLQTAYQKFTLWQSKRSHHV